MSKPMLTEAEWSRNVGTQAFPVSFLHEYAVGLLWDRLHGRQPVIVKTIDGRETGDLRQGVDRVVIPDSMQPIGGCIPDLALLDRQLRPVRVIEVVVTSPPTGDKMEKLKRLEERGVEVVIVPVRNEEELKSLARTGPDEQRLRWASLTVDGRHAHRSNENTVRTLISGLLHCSPETRRQLVQVLNELDSLESLYPLSDRNPKMAALSDEGNGE